jgi:hypothetical protein
VSRGRECLNRKNATSRDLPSLHEFAAPARTASRYSSPEVLRLLRTIALTHRNHEPQRFYSIREVSDHLWHPAAAVTRIFAQLKVEGLLTSRWGSNTMLLPESLDRGLRFRGVIAELVSVVSLINEPRCRTLVKVVSDQLWQRGFTARLWL